jgi:hypothetical protein
MAVYAVDVRERLRAVAIDTHVPLCESCTRRMCRNITPEDELELLVHTI